MQLGNFTIDWVSAGHFRLDGGAMFGVVPKVVWQKRIQCDERNRIPMGLNCMLVTTPQGRILLDAGIGNKLDAKKQDIFAIEPPTIEESLKALGLGVEDIDHVVFSHADFDHIGGATKRTEDGRIVPAFPKATYHVRKEEWDDLTHPNIRSKSTYFAENWQAIAENDQVKLIERDGEILPGIATYHTGGHTRGHVVIQITSGDEGAVYMGDLMPTHHHLNPLWVMAYDNFPMTSIEQRGSWTRTIAERDWWLMFYHDVELGAGRWSVEGELKEALRLQGEPARV